MYRGLSNTARLSITRARETQTDRQSPQMVLRTERRGQGRRREASKDLRRTVTKARDLCRAGGSRRSAGGTLCAQRKVVDNALPVPHL